MTALAFFQQMILQIAAQTMTIFFMPVFWIAVLMLMMQIWIQQSYRKKQTADMLSAFVYRCVCVLQVLLPTIMSGWLGGIIASSLLVISGVSIDLNTVFCMWCITGILLLIRRRFVCFAYAGGIVALIQYWVYHNCTAGQQILMLVAVLHFTEAILVRICGGLRSNAVYLRDRTGKTTTGHQLQMIWPLPLAIPEAVNIEKQLQDIQNGYFLMPDWWPLFTIPSGNVDAVVLYQLIPVLAAIGYYDCVKGDVRQGIHADFIRLMSYSLMLGGLVLLSCQIPMVLYAAALFSVLGHEQIAHM